MNNRGKKRCWFNTYRSSRDIGFILLVFGIVTICAFFLPPKAWIILLGVVLLVCGITLMGK